LIQEPRLLSYRSRCTDIYAYPYMHTHICDTAYNLTPGNKALFGPGCVPHSVVGVAREILKSGDKRTTEDIYVVKHLNTVLLSRPASVNLRLVARVDSIDLDAVKWQYPKLCGGLGLVQQQYTIKLRPDVKPVSLKVPRRVPLPLMGKVKQELQRMEAWKGSSATWTMSLYGVPHKLSMTQGCMRCCRGHRQQASH